MKERGRVVVTATGAEIEPMAPLTRRKWMGSGFTIAGAVIGIGGVTFGIRKLWFRSEVPTAYRVEGSTLTVLDQDGSVLWRYSFPVPMAAEAYKKPEQCVFVDLDGHGQIWTLFVYHAEQAQAADSHLVCFDAAGVPRWQFLSGKKVTDSRGRTFAPPFWPRAFQVIPSVKPNRSRIVVTSIHQWGFPDQVAVLDGITGKLLSDYWHRGHLVHLAIADIDGSRQPKVLLGGVNDAPEYAQATVVIFDHRSIDGGSRDPRGAPFFRGLRPGSEQQVIYFPRTPISRSKEFNRVSGLKIVPGRITVLVSEGIGESDPVIIYEFSDQLEVLNVMMSDEALQHYAALQERGELPRESPNIICERLKGQIKILRIGDTRA